MNGQITIPIEANILIASLIIRICAVTILAIFVLPKMIREYRSSPELRRTKIFLLGLGVAFFLGSLIPLEQIVCYLLGCLANSQILPASIVVALLNLTSVVMLAIIYNTKESHTDNEKAVEDIKESLKVIGKQTKRAEKRSEEIDLNTEGGKGKIMRGRNGMRGRKGKQQKEEEKKEEGR